MLIRPRLMPVAALAAGLLLPALSFAAAPNKHQQTHPGTTYFGGAGNLWGGTTRSAGAPPGGVPGTATGRQAHEQGVQNQHAPANQAQQKQQRSG